MPDPAALRKERKDVAVPQRFRRDLPSPIGPHPFDRLLTVERARLFRQVLARRRARVTVVLEDCYDPHNATAAMRTCEAFGLARLWVTTRRCAFKVNRRISQGTHRYLDLQVHADIVAAYAALRAEGYRIHVTDLRADARVGPQALREELAAGSRLALVFGSEGFGLSDEARQGADGCFLLPMAGFVQSLNLSVSVAVSLYSLVGDALAADAPGDLDAASQQALYERWIREQHPQAAERLLPGAGGSAMLQPRTAQSRHGEELDSFEGS